MGLLDGKVMFVTGGGEGMGRADVLLALKEGAKVAFLEYNQENANGTIAAAKEQGLEEPLVFMGDVRTPGFLEGAIDATVEKYGKLDCLVNNIGCFGSYCGAADVDNDEWDKIMDLNLKAVYRGCHAAVPYMIKNGSGSIVNVSSTAGILPTKSMGVYGIAKQAVNKLTQDMGLAYGQNNIRINCIAPGLIVTPLEESSPKDYADALASVIPMQRRGHASEIANAVVWISSDKASYVNGQILGVDGGLSVYNAY
ncbi:MAG: glucose 1-dehydrogenase [Oscillospiraceae bacterium]|nr:glucose 1-dehydrogenase [Oscillospiraceae bacterium]MBQ7123764.1 glucose 1-dehydrogenase [Oscillospiraceae bacterium]